MPSLCPRCQAPLPQAAAFCTRCGSPVAPAEPAEAPKTSRMAITAFVFAFIPVCLNLVGAALGIAALVRIGRAPKKLQGKGLAIAAIAVGCGNLFFGTGIVAAIAIPNFVKYQARAKQAEAKMGLERILHARGSAEARLGRAPEDLKELGFEPPERHRYAYFYGGDAVQPAEGGPYQVPADLQDAGEETVAIAVGNIDADETLDVWVLKSDGRIENVVNDIAE